MSDTTRDIVFRHHFKRLEPLMYGKVVGIVVDDSADDGAPFVGLHIKCPNGDTYEIIAMRDEEGNGAGDLMMGKILTNGKTTVG